MTQKSDNENTSHDKSDSRQRKERVLHTRIPTVLEEELKNLAENLRVPVSNLVRTILQDALRAAEEVGRAAEGELRDAANRLAAERERLNDMAAASGEHLRHRVARTVPDLERVEDRDGDGDEPPSAPPDDAAEASTSPGAPAEPAPSPLDGVLGFQELRLAIESRCALCDRPLSAGEPAYLGVRDGPGPRVIIGPECLPGSKETES